MSTGNLIPSGPFAPLLTELQKHRRWLLGIGIVLVLLGIAAILEAVIATVVSTLFVGWILLVAGIAEGIYAFRHRPSGHLLLHALNTILQIVVGVMLLWKPLAGAAALTLLLAAYFVVAGLFRAITALSLRTPGWGWTLVNGLVTLLLGVLVWVQWPSSGLWVLGLFVGIDLIFLGWSQVMMAAALKRIDPATR